MEMCVSRDGSAAFGGGWAVGFEEGRYGLTNTGGWMVMTLIHESGYTYVVGNIQTKIPER